MPDTYHGPATSLALFEALVATIPEVQLKGATMPYTSFNGHMFSLLDPSGTLALRLPKVALADFLRRYGTTLSEQYGRVMREYAVVPPALLARTDELSGWFALSYDWIGTLRPKATTRRATKPS
ncbi:hypothetical protein [Leifsonia sp. NPDC058248]|uniref:hypothetical protein n=1 Tax=Leifsonia sp. NPDC058248 TaxID=3346402 RepID=UPI0036DB9979